MNKKALLPLAGLYLLFFPAIIFAQFQHLDQALPRLMGSADVPGLTIAVIENGRVAYGNAFGIRSQDSGLPVDDRTVFAAASLSKPLFAFAVMQLVEEGKFDLDRPLAEYLDYEDLRHDPRYRSITARMVLSHTAGLPNWRSGRLDLLTAPGQKFSYSGEGFVFLQKTIERITGQSLEAFMQQRVFKPLGMESSSYVWQSSFEGNFAVPHTGLGTTDRKYKPQEANAAHSLQTTAPDYAKFLIAMLNGIGIRKSSLDLMATEQVKLPDNQQIGWGLGWGIQETGDGKALWHWGDNGTFKCFAIAFPAQKSGLVFFTNSQNGLSFVEALLKESLGAQCPACQWMDYKKYDSPSFGLLRKVRDLGFDAAMQPFLAPGGQVHNTSLFSEDDMNSLGYGLMNLKRFEDAKRAFKMNLLAFPNSANAHDSYAEACLRNGEQELARENYARAFELDRTYTNAGTIAQQLSKRNIGNTTFTLNDYPNAKLVCVSGDFNNWSGILHPCRRQDGVWTATLDLAPGQHQYKFVVDGVWVPDPANPNVSNDLNHNSIIEVKGLVPNRPNTPIAQQPLSPAKDLLKKYADAAGGKEKWKELKNYVVEMHSLSGAGNVTLTAFMKKPNKYRIDLDNPPNKMIKTYNGTKGVVSINYRPQEMGAGEQAEMAEEADFFDELLFSEERGYAPELVGEDMLDGRKVIKIKITKNKTDVQTYFLDAETYLPAMVTEHSQDENFRGVLFKTLLSDYRQVDGVQFPHKISLMANDNLMWERAVDSVKFNTKVEDKVFEGK